MSFLLFIVLAPAAYSLPKSPGYGAGETNFGICSSLRRITVYMWLCAPLFVCSFSSPPSTPHFFFLVKLVLLCGFYTWSKVLVLALQCSVHERGKQHCVVQERALSPFLVCGHWYLRGRWGVLREAHIAVLSLVLCVTCVCSKSLVLLCKRTSPPGAHEVYVQNNKWQMNNHTSVNQCVLAAFWAPLGYTPESVSTTQPSTVRRGNASSLYLPHIFSPTH